MSDVVVDTSIVIDYLRGLEAARRYLEDLDDRGLLATHTIVIAETLPRTPLSSPRHCQARETRVNRRP